MPEPENVHMATEKMPMFHLQIREGERVGTLGILVVYRLASRSPRKICLFVEKVMGGKDSAT